jgi:hypothetical protein
MTLAMYARRKRWPLEAVTITLRHSKIHAADCEACETKDARIDQIECDIELTGMLSDDQRARLLEIANQCPVHRTLTSEIHIQPPDHGVRIGSDAVRLQLSEQGREAKPVAISSGWRRCRARS